MPSLTRKVIKGRSYYYARWCQRVGGRPKIVKTAYLGPLENIVQAVETAQQPLPPQTAEVSHFADVAALYDQATQLGLIELLDAQVPKREQGLSVRQHLGLLVSTDFHVPLMHKVYTGNLTDATAFQTISEELAHQYRQLAEGCQHITLIFDKGNNSIDAFQNLDQSDFHFVGSLVPTQHPDLLKIPLEQLRPLSGPRLEGVSAYRTGKKVFDQQRTVLTTFNEALLEGQLQGITANLEKARAKLAALQNCLRRRQQGRVKGGRAPTADSVAKQVEQILSGQHLKQLIHCEVTGGAVPSLSYRSDTAALSRLVETQLGKTLLFTDNQDWSDQEIVLGYRAQHHIESAFRDMKNPHFLGWSPMFHWTDSKIRVHAFYCVLALLLTSLLQRTLHGKGIDLSLTRMMEVLRSIQEVLVIYPRQQGQRVPRTASCLSRLEEQEQQRVYEALNLGRYQAA